jgi:hypothetical protein
MSPTLRKYGAPLLLVMLALQCAYGQTSRDGILDLKTFDLHESSVALDGFWQFFPRQILRPESNISKDISSTIKIPSWWTASETNPPLQYASYRLRVLLPKDHPVQLALKIPAVYTSYELFVDGTLVGGNGNVGTTKEESKPQWKPGAFTFAPKRDTLEIVITLSNFHHYRSGINESIYLGDADSLISQQSNTQVSGTILFVALWIFAIVSLVINFFPGKRNAAHIYYAFLCIAWSLRTIFSNYYLAVQWFPDVSWELCVRFEYITLYLTTLFGSLLIGALFPRDVNKIFRMVYIVTCSLFTLLTLLTAPVVFTQFVQLYIALSGALLASILVIVTKAYIESRHGLGFLIVCLFFAVVMFAYVILAFQGLFELNMMIFHGGFLMLFLLGGIATASRVIKMNTTQDYDVLTIDSFKLK